MIELVSIHTKSRNHVQIQPPFSCKASSNTQYTHCKLSEGHIRKFHCFEFMITVGNPSLLGFHSLNPVVNGFMHTITFANCLIKAVYHVSSKNSAQLLKLCQI